MAKEVRVGGARIDIVANTAKFDAGLRRAQTSIEKFQSNVQSALSRLKDPKIIAGGVIVAGTAIAAAAINIGNQYDQAFAKIRRGTGATGKVLEGLKRDFDSVFSAGDDSAEEVATAISNLNTRLNLTGAPLQKLSSQLLDLSDVTGASIDQLSTSLPRLYGDWEIEASRAAKANDFLYKVSQYTGIEVVRLADLMVQYGAPLRQFGIGFEEATAMLGKFEKEGVNTELVLSAMRQSIPRFAEAGLSIEDGFRAAVEVIKETKDETKALEIGFSVFGKRMGSDMVEAIKQGRFELDEFLTKLNSSDESIKKAAESSETLSQKWEKMTNVLGSMLAPLGSVIVDTLKYAVEKIDELLWMAANGWRMIIDGLVEKFNEAREFFSGAVKTPEDWKIDKSGKITGGLIDRSEAVSLEQYRVKLREINTLVRDGEITDRAAAKAKQDLRAALELYNSEAKKGSRVTEEAKNKIRALAGDADEASKNVGTLGDTFNKTKFEVSGENLKNTLEDSYQSSVDFWENIFENAITGTTFSLEDALKRIAVGFAAQLMAGLTDGMGAFGRLFSSFTSGQDLGGSIANMVLGQSGGGGGSSGMLSNILGGAGGASMFAEGTWASGFSAGITGTATVPASAAASSGLSAGASVASAMPYVAAALAVYGIADHFGAFDGGPTNPQTIARNDFAGYIEEALKEKGSLQWMDNKGVLRQTDNILVGDSSKFNAPGWAEGLNNKYGSETVNAFTGIASAIMQKAGIKDGVGAQGGALLLEQFEGSFDALQQIIDKVGLSYEDFINLMIERGKEGGESWLEIVSQINDSSQAFQSGIQGLGEYKKATDQFFQAAGRGFTALNKARAMGVEADEAGIKTYEEYINKLEESGQYSAQQIEALRRAGREGQIETIQQLKELDDLAAARFNATVDASLQDQGVIWEDLVKKVDEYKEKIESVNNKQVKVDFFIQSKFDENTQKLIDSKIMTGESGGSIPVPAVPEFAKGGVFNSPTLGIFGEAGPEAILPLARGHDGKLGVRMNGARGAGDIVVNVDARGADAGVEQRLMAIIPAIIEQTLREVG